MLLRNTKGLLGLGLAVVFASCAESTPTARAMVGVSGGRVQLSEGPAQGSAIEIPNGALASSVEITVQAHPSTTPGLPAGTQAQGPIVLFGPEGQTFAHPVTLRLPSPNRATAMYTRPLNGTTWTLVPGATWNATTHEMVAQVQHFSEFVPVSLTNCTPSAESCNGVDDDCDGVVDEDCPSACSTNAQCASGQQCIDGVCLALGCVTNADCAAGLVCVAGTCTTETTCTPSEELCNGLDDDCDGIVDNGCTAHDVIEEDATDGGDGGTGCSSDLDCAVGQICVANACVASTCVPSEELCNGLDDDCDGIVDNGCSAHDVIEEDATDGGDGAVDCRSDGDCAAGQLCILSVCTTVECVPSDEVCDGIDNDCDGIVDNGCTPTDVPTDTGIDASDSGSCTTNNDCAAGQTCSGGSCH